MFFRIFFICFPFWFPAIFLVYFFLHFFTASNLFLLGVPVTIAALRRLRSLTIALRGSAFGKGRIYEGLSYISHKQLDSEDLEVVGALMLRAMDILMISGSGDVHGVCKVWWI